MYEPKYKLNRTDEARWRRLATREACELGPPNKKFPPLSPAERVELECLQHKRSKKICSHPRVRAEIEHSRRLMRRGQRLMKKVDAVLKELEKNYERRTNNDVPEHAVKLAGRAQEKGRH